MKNHHDSKKTHKNLISRWVHVITFYKFFLWSKILWKKFHENFFEIRFPSSDIWIDVLRKLCCEINKYYLEDDTNSFDGSRPAGERLLFFEVWLNRQGTILKEGFLKCTGFELDYSESWMKSWIELTSSGCNTS